MQTQNKMAEKKQTNLFIYLLLIGILVVSSIALTTVLKHKDIYENNPAVYWAQQNDIDSCLCSNPYGEVITIDQEKVTVKKTARGTLFP